MKAFFATFSALVFLVIAWLVMAMILSVIGDIGLLARPRLGFIYLLHTYVIFLLSPGIGGFFGIYLTSTVFHAVDLKTLYVSFVSVVATILTLYCLVVLIAFSSGKLSIEGILISLLQAAAIFLGAWVGRLSAFTHRATQGA